MIKHAAAGLYTYAEFALVLCTFNPIMAASSLRHRGDPTQITSQVPPTLLWNQWWVFVLVVLLITAEWVLRKMKHLL